MSFNASAASNVAESIGRLYTFSFAAEDGGPPTTAPEPATIILLGSTLSALGLFGRKGRRRQ